VPVVTSNQLKKALNPAEQRELEIGLCLKAREGDLVAGSELITLYYERIFLWFQRLCGNQADAEDLTQKTFAKVWRSIASFEARSAFSTWIYRIGHNVYLDWIRQNGRSGPIPEEWWEGCVVDCPTPVDEIIDREMSRSVYALVEQLGEDTRSTVHLHYYQGLSLAETAEVMGVATSTVKYRVRQAVTELRGRLNEPERMPSAAKTRKGKAT
jgi:RNA polymerase sigma factor (sigma-70 family)